MSNPNERDQAVFRQVWPSWLGVPNDWGARRIAEYREHCVKVERERILAAVQKQAEAWREAAHSGGHLNCANTLLVLVAKLRSGREVEP